MCITIIAKKINIFNRDNSEITKADVFATYLFIILSIFILYWYSHKYWELASEYYDECKEMSSNSKECIRSDISHLLMPYIAIVYGFFMSFYKISNIIALGCNYICCCYACCLCRNNSNTKTKYEANN